VSVIDSTSSSSRTWTGYSNDSVTISSQHSPDRLAFFAFKSAHELMAHSKDAYALNSRVVAVAARVDHVPVDVRLRHLTATTSSEAVCVRWDHEHAAWTADGCVVDRTDSVHTLCRCDRLGAYAVMTPSSGESAATASTTSVTAEDASASSFTLEIVTYAVAVICIVILVLILLQVRASFQMFQHRA